MPTQHQLQRDEIIIEKAFTTQINPVGMIYR